MNRLSPITLEGRFVRLEPLSTAHLDGLFATAIGRRDTYHLAFVPHTRAGMSDYIDEALADWGRELALPFATIERASGEVVGTTRFQNVEFWRWGERIMPPPPLPSGPDVVEIGRTWLVARVQRTAVNTEAKLLMLGHAFERWGVRRVSLKADHRNTRSRSAIERLGARLDGVLRAHMPASDGVARDSAMYSILSHEWPACAARLEAFLAAHHAATP
jgi:RimJ/RimL family protein N-acetyltransferase